MIDNLKLADLLKPAIDAIAPKNGKWHQLSFFIFREADGTLLTRFALVEIGVAGDTPARDV